MVGLICCILSVHLTMCCALQDVVYAEGGLEISRPKVGLEPHSDKTPSSGCREYSQGVCGGTGGTALVLESKEVEHIVTEAIVKW